MEIWVSKPPGTLWVTPGLLRDCFTLFYFITVIGEKHSSVITGLRIPVILFPGNLAIASFTSGLF